jgi:hypothetical protein
VAGSGFDLHAQPINRTLANTGQSFSTGWVATAKRFGMTTRCQSYSSYMFGDQNTASLSVTLAKLYQTAKVIFIGVTDGNLVCFAFVSYLFLKYCKSLTIMKQAFFKPSCHTRHTRSRRLCSHSDRISKQMSRLSDWHYMFGAFLVQAENV